MKDLIIGGRKFTNRFFLGTGKFASSELFRRTLEASETELVTTALTRVHENDAGHDDILKAIDRSKVEIMLNTSGARNADEAVRIGLIGQATGFNWIKLEIHPDARYLLPDPVETLKAVEILAKRGLVVLPYINADPVLARRLEEAGAAAVMPLGAPIGSNKGLATADFIQILIDEIELPIIVDAGIGAPSQACRAMEMGAAAIMANTALATSGDVPRMARAFKLAIEAGRQAYLAGLGRVLSRGASASDPLTGFLH